MDAPRTEGRARLLAANMDRSIADVANPDRDCGDWLASQAREHMPKQGIHADFGSGTGRILFGLLDKFSGTLYAIEPMESMMRQLITNFYERGLQGRINLVPIIAYSHEILAKQKVMTIDADGTVQEIENPFLSGVKVTSASATEVMHECLSMPALEAGSVAAGYVALGKTLDAIANIMQRGSIFLLQDLHGAEKFFWTQYQPAGKNRLLVQRLVNWVTDPNYKMPLDMMHPEHIRADNDYWTPGRRRVLREMVIGNKEPRSGRDILRNVVPEVVYRVRTTLDGMPYADLDHEVHAGLSWLELDRLVRERRLKMLDQHAPSEKQTMAFIGNLGVVVGSGFPSVYSAGVYRKVQ